MLTCGGSGVENAHISIPARGPATAEVLLDTATDPPVSVVLAEEGGISLVMTVARGGVNPALLRWEGVLVGGAGGLGRPVSGAFEHAQVRDVLSAIASQAGEAISSTIATSLLSLELEAWTLGRCSAASALDQLAGAAGAALGEPVTWRVLSDGSIWLGVETWPAATLPVTDDVVDPSPLVAYNAIAATVPALLPGVDLAGCGRIVLVDHYVRPHEVRTWAFTQSQIDAAGFRRLVRAALGLEGETPQIDRLAHYKARVVACASDGSTVDLQPDDPRITARKNVRVVVGVPGLSAVVEPGAVMWIGWEAGDPARPRAVPAWESATVTKLVLAATMVFLGGESGAQFVALANKVQAYLVKLEAAIAGWTPTPNDGGAALKAQLTTQGIGTGAGWGSDVAAAQTKAV